MLMSFIQFWKTQCNWPTCIIAFSALASTLKYRTNRPWQSWSVPHQQDSSVEGKDGRIMVYKDHPFKNCEIKSENSALQFANCYFPWSCWADNFTKENPDHMHKPRNKEKPLWSWLLLFLLKQRQEWHPWYLHHFEPHSRNISNSMTFSAKPSDQNLIL